MFENVVLDVWNNNSATRGWELREIETRESAFKVGVKIKGSSEKLTRRLFKVDAQRNVGAGFMPLTAIKERDAYLRIQSAIVARRGLLWPTNKICQTRQRLRQRKKRLRNALCSRISTHKRLNSQLRSSRIPICLDCSDVNKFNFHWSSLKWIVWLHPQFNFSI